MDRMGQHTVELSTLEVNIEQDENSEQELRHSIEPWFKAI